MIKLAVSAARSVVIIHPFADVPDIDIHRAQADASTAADTLNSLVVFVYKIFQFMHETLPDPMGFCATGIVAGTV